MYTLTAFIVLVADIVAIIDCIQRRMGRGKKALWALLILLFPLVGMLLYFIFRKK